MNLPCLCVSLALCLSFAFCYPNSIWKTSPFTIPDSDIIMPSAIEIDGASLFIYTMVVNSANTTIDIYKWNAKPAIPVQNSHQNFISANPIENPIITFLNNNVKITFVEPSGPTAKFFILQKSDLTVVSGGLTAYQTHGIYHNRLEIFFEVDNAENAYHQP